MSLSGESTTSSSPSRRQGSYRHPPESIEDLLDVFTNGNGQISEADKDRIMEKHLLTRQQIQDWLIDRNRRWGVDGHKMLVSRCKSFFDGSKGSHELKISDLPLAKMITIEQIQVLVQVILNLFSMINDRKIAVSQAKTAVTVLIPALPKVHSALATAEKQIALLEEICAKRGRIDISQLRVEKKKKSSLRDDGTDEEEEDIDVEN